LKIRAYGKTKKELFLNMASGMQDALQPTTNNKQLTTRSLKIRASNLETLLVDFLSEILYLIQVNKEIYKDIKFKKFTDMEIRAELIGQKVASFGEDIKGVTYHDLEIKQNPMGIWQATVLFDV